MEALAETERIRLREFTPGDTRFILELLNTEGWKIFIGDRQIHTEKDAENYLLQGPIKSYRQNNYGLWKVESKQSGHAIGMCGILKRDSLPHPDIGFAFLPEYCNRGFAFEAASACLNYAVNHLKIQVIMAITVPHNLNSIKLLQKIGLKLKSSFHQSDQGEELLLFCNK